MKLLTTPEAVQGMHSIVAANLHIEGVRGMRTYAYEEGAEACRRGDDPEMNPFDDNDVQRDEWEDGWFDEAAEEFRKEGLQ